jgi:hypothetical protein
MGKLKTQEVTSSPNKVVVLEDLLRSVNGAVIFEMTHSRFSRHKTQSLLKEVKSLVSSGKERVEVSLRFHLVLAIACFIIPSS